MIGSLAMLRMRFALTISPILLAAIRGAAFLLIIWRAILTLILDAFFVYSGNILLRESIVFYFSYCIIILRGALTPLFGLYAPLYEKVNIASAIFMPAAEHEHFPQSIGIMRSERCTDI